MYPQRDLNRLALHKAALCGRIVLERASCAAAMGRVLQPLAWLDRMLILWRQFSPLLRRVPLGVLVQRATRPRWKMLGSLVAWSPLVFDLVRAFRSPIRPASRPSGLPSRSRR